MAFKQITSPHGHKRQSTGRIMQLVLIATLPGLLVLSYQFGWGILINLFLAVFAAISAEALILKIRQRPIGL